MTNLRQIIDGKVLQGAGVIPPPKPAVPVATKTPATKAKSKTKVSPAAEQVANHMQDPVGETQDAFQDLGDKQMQYNLARENMKRQLLPVQSIIQHVNQMHQLAGDPNNPDDPMNMNPDQAEGYQDPNDPNQSMGQPKPGVPGMPGNPQGPAQSKVPPKMGMPQPGNPKTGAPNVPGAGNSNIQTNPAAAKPKGAGQMPGAKPAAKGKPKAGQAGRQIKIAVHASILPGARMNVNASRGVGALKFGTGVDATVGMRPLPPGGLSEGHVSPSGSGIRPSGGPKAPSGTMSRFNAGKVSMCKACGKMHAEGKCSKTMGGKLRSR